MPASKNKKANEKAELLKQAASTGDLEKIKELVKNGANVNKAPVSDSNRYSLEHAARNGHADCMRYLLDNGAKLNPRRKRGQRVLLFAAASGNPECIQIILDKGMNVDEKGEYGETAVMLAAEYKNPDCMKLLLQYKPDLSATYKYSTVLYIAAEHNSTECVRLLLNHTPKPDVNFTKPHSKYGTPLCVASYYGHTDIVKLLLENGANVNYNGSHEYGPLKLAFEGGKLDCIQILCDYGADMKKTAGKYSMLTFATGNAQLPILEEFLKRGCDPNERGPYLERRPMDIALAAFIKDTGKRLMRSKILKKLLTYGTYLDLCRLTTAARDLFYNNNLKQVEMYCLAMLTSCPTCAQSLYIKAISMFEKDPIKLNQVEAYHEKAMSLENQACRYIRRSVNSSGLHPQAKNFPAKVDSLPLPEEVKNLILVKHTEPLIEAPW